MAIISIICHVLQLLLQKELYAKQGLLPTLFSLFMHTYTSTYTHTYVHIFLLCISTISLCSSLFLHFSLTISVCVFESIYHSLLVYVYTHPFFSSVYRFTGIHRQSSLSLSVNTHLYTRFSFHYHLLLCKCYGCVCVYISTLNLFLSLSLTIHAHAQFTYIHTMCVCERICIYTQSHLYLPLFLPICHIHCLFRFLSLRKRLENVFNQSAMKTMSSSASILQFQSESFGLS